MLLTALCLPGRWEGPIQVGGDRCTPEHLCGAPALMEGGKGTGVSCPALGDTRKSSRVGASRPLPSHDHTQRFSPLRACLHAAPSSLQREAPLNPSRNVTRAG